MPAHAQPSPLPLSPDHGFAPVGLADPVHEDLEGLLVGLRLDVAWLDRCLAEQAGSTGEAVSTLRMQMRIRCDGMGEQLEQLAGHLERMRAVLRQGTGRA